MARTYGRTYDANGNPTWIVVKTDAQGFNDFVYATAIVQVLKLNLGESPFYANYGIPAKPSVVQQVAPDYYTLRTQQQFSQYFASLIVAKSINHTPKGAPIPTYKVNITTHQGVKLATEIPV